MKKLILLSMFAAMAMYTFAANTVALTVTKTTKTCTPDGVANTDGSEPWTTTWIDMAAEKTANTVHEMTAHFQLAFNNTYLWIAAEQMGNATIDTDHTAIPNSWERDDFEVFVTMDTTAYAHKGAYGEYNNQFRLQRAAEYPWSFDDAHSIGANNPGTFTIGQVDAGDGSFVQEWQLPWAGLTAPMADSGTFDGALIRFEIQAADNTTGATGGRNDQRFWIDNSDNAYQDSRVLSVVKLDPKVNVGIPTLKVNNNFRINGNRLTLSQVGTVRIYNVSGQLLKVVNNTLSVDISGLSSGLYIANANGLSTKFIKK
jgi:hypothetical protein